LASPFNSTVHSAAANRARSENPASDFAEALVVVPEISEMGEAMCPLMKYLSTTGGFQG
jgi:hypothetical protein